MIEQFIKDAIAGGWQPKISPVDFQLLTVPMQSRMENYRQAINQIRVTEDILAWSAVAKTNNWPARHYQNATTQSGWFPGVYEHEQFEHYRKAGKSIDEALMMIYSPQA